MLRKKYWKFKIKTSSVINNKGKLSKDCINAMYYLPLERFSNIMSAGQLHKYTLYPANMEASQKKPHNPNAQFGISSVLGSLSSKRLPKLSYKMIPQCQIVLSRRSVCNNSVSMKPV